MRTVRRLLVASVLVYGLLPEGGALADGRAGAFVNDDGDPTAEATEVVSTPGSGSGGAGPQNCTWRVLNADDAAVPMYEVDGTRMTSPTGRWLQRVCDGEVVPVNGRFAVPESLPGADPAVLARQARESVAIPEPPISTSPDAGRSLYARVPTWLWIDGGWWRPYSVTAAVGGVSTTVIATPVRAVWSMGDGGEAVCGGPGRPWESGMAEDAADCSYTYASSSAGEPGESFTVTVTVELAISWSSNLGTGGNLAAVTRSSSRSVTVGEIQAIETA